MRTPTPERSESAQRFFVGLAAVSRTIRDQDDLSQSDVARRGGVSEWLVSNIENVHANPTATCLDRLAKGLGLDGVPELVTLAVESADRIEASLIRRPD
jgi:transcriptional regulator with XRE-family HTH domain